MSKLTQPGGEKNSTQARQGGSRLQAPLPPLSKEGGWGRRGRAGNRAKRRNPSNSRHDLLQGRIVLSGLLPPLPSPNSLFGAMKQRLRKSSHCSKSCSRPVADLAWNPGCDSSLMPPHSAHPAHIHRGGHPVEEVPPKGAAAGASSKRVFSSSAFPAVGRRGPGPHPATQPPDLRGCSVPSGVENSPAGHSLNSPMQLFQKPNNWTLCSLCIGTGNVGSSLEDILYSWGQYSGLGSGEVASGANHDMAVG